MVAFSVKWRGATCCELALDAQSTVLLAKEAITAHTQVEPSRQKLFFKGKLLRDADTLAQCGIEDGSALMLMGTPSQIIVASTVSPRDISIIDGKLFDSGDAAPPAAAQAIETQRPAVDAPMGLVNLGNTCYMNATLQALYAVDELRSVLARDTERSNFLVSAIAQLFASMTKDAEQAKTLPLGVLAALHKRFPHFAQRGEQGMLSQQDAEECMGGMLQELNASDSAISDIFTGAMTVAMSNAETGENSTTSEPFTKLSCHISQGTIDLMDGLHASLAETVTKHSDLAGRSVPFQKTSRIASFPPYLCVNFVRFFWKPKEQVKAKILKKVKFPLAMDLKAIAAPDVSCSEYDLVSVVTHVGRSADSGHYIAWVRGGPSSGQDTWWKCDDETVSAVSSEDVKKLDGGGDWHTAYVCIYKRRSV